MLFLRDAYIVVDGDKGTNHQDDRNAQIAKFKNGERSDVGELSTARSVSFILTFLKWRDWTFWRDWTTGNQVTRYSRLND